MRGIVVAGLGIALASAGRADEVGPATPPAGAPTLTVGVPDGTGPVAGFDRALFTELGREAGLGVAFAVVSPDAAATELDAGRIDVAAGPFPIAAAPGRRALPPVLTDGDALLKRQGDGSLLKPADVAGKRLGLLGPRRDAARLGAEAATLHARVALRPGAFGREPEREMAAGRVAALIGPLADVAGAQLARPDAVEAVGPPFGPVRRLAPMLRADRSETVSRLEAALGRLRADGRLAALQRRWFGLVFDAPPLQPPPVSTPKP